MKLKKILLFGFVSLLFAPIFISCSDDDEQDVGIPIVQEAAYILNSGKFQKNNASITMFDLNTQNNYDDVFEFRNRVKLGDTGQDMIIYGSKMYISVYGSNIIYITDRDCNIIDTIKPMRENQPQSPQNFAINDGKVYVTMFDGYLARIDTTSLKIEKQVKVGRNPENVVCANGKLYVANSGGMDYPNYDNTVSIVDINTFTLLKNINVVINPRKLVTDNQGDVYLISNGNYSSDPSKLIPNTLQRIDTKTDVVQTITTTNATFFTSTGDKLYMIYAQMTKDAQGNPIPTEYIIYDAINESVLSKNFITDGTSIQSPCAINIDKVTGNIYIGDANGFSLTSDMLIFSPQGKLLKKFNTKSYNIMGTVFMRK